MDIKKIWVVLLCLLFSVNIEGSFAFQSTVDKKINIIHQKFRDLDEYYGLDYISWAYQKKQLQKYKSLLKKLYSEIELYERKIDGKIKVLLKPHTRFSGDKKKKIKELLNSKRLLEELKKEIYVKTPTSQEGRLIQIEHYLSYYEINKKVEEEKVVIQKELIKIEEKKKSKADYYEELYFKSLEQKYSLQKKAEKKRAAAERKQREKAELRREKLKKRQDERKEYGKSIIDTYYSTLQNGDFEGAYRFKYLPQYSLERFRNVFSNVIWVNLKNKKYSVSTDTYMLDVELYYIDWKIKKYRNYVQVREGKIKTLSSQELK